MMMVCQFEGTETETGIINDGDYLERLATEPLFLTLCRRGRYPAIEKGWDLQIR